MTGLDLESLLRLLRADLGAWLSLGLIVLLLALLAWTSWGSRRALRKCLVLSVAVHVGLVAYWFSQPSLLPGLGAKPPEIAKEGIRQIRVVPISEGSDPKGSPAGGNRPPRRLAAWDRPRETLALADLTHRAPRPIAAAQHAEVKRPEPAAPEMPSPVLSPPEAPSPGDRPETEAVPELVAPMVAPAGTDEIAASEPVGSESADPEPIRADRQVRPDRPATAPTSPEIARREPKALNLPEVDGNAPPLPPSSPEGRPDTQAVASDAPSPAIPDDPDARGPARPKGVARPVPDEPTEAATAGPPLPPADPEPAISLPDADVRRRSRPAPPSPSSPTRRGQAEPTGRLNRAAEPIAMGRVVPSGGPKLPDIRGATGGRPLSDVPEVYRSRLDPNRSTLAKRAGATAASEQAVERALDWLAKHQDADGSWDGKVARTADGTPLPGDDDYTVHCPPGDICPGDCFYWEADTALTGLALLAYLGAGYTHTDGVYSDTVARGLDFLVLSQKPDGDLRGPSRAVGMYCHAMASLALCEAYALTADDRLRVPVERAVNFLVKARSPGGGWRYAPGDPLGDTSILGWAVLVLKSARFAGIAVPKEAEASALTWLNKVADGPDGGLARYQPAKAVTETMTAEAWVCRLFLGAGADGRGAADSEASAYLMARAPDRGEYNVYYWYYGTLAMYMHGGPSWPRWNAQVRDQLVRRQKTKGHQAGSWDPDETAYGSRGGRIYGTALAALTLEVYYRYLRLYDEPSAAPIIAPAPERPADSTLRRAGGARPAANGRKKQG